MFRALALTIVLTLAAGPPATLLCSGWCNDAAAPADVVDSCRHGDSTARVRIAGVDPCDRVLDLTAFVREEVRRPAAGSAAPAGAIVAQYGFVGSTGKTSSLFIPPLCWSLDQRPLTAILRI